MSQDTAQTLYLHIYIFIYPSGWVKTENRVRAVQTFQIRKTYFSSEINLKMFFLFIKLFTWVWIFELHYNFTGSRSTLNFGAGSTFPVPVCTLPSSMNRNSWCNKVDAVRLYASYRLNLLLLKGQRCLICLNSRVFTKIKFMRHSWYDFVTSQLAFLIFSTSIIWWHEIWKDFILLN